MIRMYVANVKKLNEDTIFEKCFAKMPKDRQEKIQRLKHRMDQNRSLGAGILLARGLFACGIRIEDVTIVEDENGKLYLADAPQIHFNLSHAGDYAVAAFAEVPVGIDIEQRRKYSERVVKRFNKEEKEVFAACRSEEEREELFLQCWTMKESAAKVSGMGIRLPFDTICRKENGQVEVKWKEHLWKYNLKEFELWEKDGILVKERQIGETQYRIAVCVEAQEEPVWEEIHYEEI